ncbi:hypothetical protein CL633_00510 [bacterium]|nr:hypothetical protein [bacterium]|tara:strand:- start:13540 stop:14673 length:1134 start_codon:yes stop_codon:yes gene_type:complete
MKKLIFASFIVLFFLGILMPVFSYAQEQAEINFFFSQTCPYCAKEKEFLISLEAKYPELKINKYDISKPENIKLWQEFYEQYNVPQSQQGLVPATFTNNNYFIGFNEQIAKDIENCIKDCILGNEPGNQDNKIILPIIGAIDPGKYSLPALAVILGALDGFNICSLGALIFILTLVLSLKSRKKTLIFGGLFIITTSVIYGVLIVLWYQVFAIFSRYLKSLEILIGLIGLVGAVYFLREFIYFSRHGAVCKMGLSQRIIAKFSKKFQVFFEKSGNIILLALAILLFAGIITIIEFPCSALVPVAFAGILAKANLSSFSYLLYIIIFIAFYMLDEIIVFLIAFFTAKIWFAKNKSLTTWLTLVQAIILFLLGIYYLFL